MRMGRIILGVIIGLAALAISGWLTLRSLDIRSADRSLSPPGPPATERKATAIYEIPLPDPESPAPAEKSQAKVAAAGSPLAARLHLPDQSAGEDVELLRQILGQYFSSLQDRPGPPIGDNQDLVRVLTGANPMRLPVIPPAHPAIDQAGRLLDRWGKPYHFHPLGGASFTVRSAGPDQRLFTGDDFVSSGDKR